MKRLTLIALLCGAVTSGFAQTSIFGLYGGGGTSTSYNYDVGLSGGLSFVKFGDSRVGFGGQLFYQGYNFLYDNEANGGKNYTGNAGDMILDKTSYIFLAPKISTFLTKGYFIEGYLNFGAGFKMSGTETMHKWDRSLALASYDSTINTSSNVNSMLFRVGVGFNEYAHLGGHNSMWWFTFTEDAGFLTNSITKSSDYNDPERNYYSPDRKIDPVYLSFQIGISHEHVKSTD